MYSYIYILPPYAALCAIKQVSQDEAAALQLMMQKFVSDNEELEKIAQDAFQSYVSSYAAYPSELKAIFSVRKLHLGHTAKSFGLHEPPKAIAKASGESAKRDEKKKQKQENKSKRKASMRVDSHELRMSEFAA